MRLRIPPWPVKKREDWFNIPARQVICSFEGLNLTPDNYRSLNTAKKGFLCEKIKKNVEYSPKKDQKMHKKPGAQRPIKPRIVGLHRA